VSNGVRSFFTTGAHAAEREKTGRGVWARRPTIPGAILPQGTYDSTFNSAVNGPNGIILPLWVSPPRAQDSARGGEAPA